MGLLDDVNAAITAAMKARDQARLVPLRMLKAALTNREVERRQPLDESECIAVVRSLVKQRRDSIDQFTKGGRLDLAEKERAEIGLLETYLPPAMDPAELASVIRDTIAELNATTPKDMGRVMKTVMGKLAGRAVDGKVVSDLVRQQLTG